MADNIQKDMNKQNSIIEVDLSAIRSNLRLIKREIGDSGIMAVVKADAYGHGGAGVAGAVEGQVSAFAVNDLREGIELREAGITKPVLVFEVPERDRCSAYTSYDLTATVSALDHFETLPEGCSYHLNFDTGMGRLGLRPEQLEKAVSKIKSRTELQCTGIYSHFATADEPGSEQVLQQLEMFKEIKSSFDESLPAHMANTGGVFFYPASHFDMVRVGIGMYGYAPGRTAIPELKQAISWSSRLVQVCAVEKGGKISYGARWSAPADGYIGIVPVGYEDGVRRILSGRMEVEIDGTRYPVAGTITMNYLMVYLGDREIAEGTTVELINRAELSVSKWAGMLDTIPYEVLTSLNRAIPRRYVES